MRPKGVADAHPVNIPELPDDRYHDGGTQEANQARVRMSGLRPVGGTSRKIRWFTFPEGSKRRRKAIKLVTPRCREKPLRRLSGTRTANRHR